MRITARSQQLRRKNEDGVGRNGEPDALGIASATARHARTVAANSDGVDMNRVTGPRRMIRSQALSVYRWSPGIVTSGPLPVLFAAAYLLVAPLGRDLSAQIAHAEVAQQHWPALLDLRWYGVSRTTFGLGLAMALGALLTLAFGRPRITVMLAVPAALSSPVAGLFLGVAGGGLFLSGKRRSGVTLAIAGVVPTIAVLSTPGEVIARDAVSLTMSLPKPGEYALRVHWSPYLSYLSLSTGCVKPAQGEWSTVVVQNPGTATLEGSLAPRHC